MNLELENHASVKDPDAPAISKALSRVQGFAILSKDKMTYIQASGSAKDGFLLEYQEGNTEQHYQGPGQLSLDQATRAFISYAQDDESWKTSVLWRRDAKSEPTLAPSIRRHDSLQTLFAVVGSIGAPGAWVYYKFYAEHGIGTSVVEGVVFFGLFILGYLVPRALFRHLIGAKCPAPNCRGRAFPKGTQPIVYVCGSCRRSYPTEWSEGDSSGTVGPTL